VLAQRLVRGDRVEQQPVAGVELDRDCVRRRGDELLHRLLVDHGGRVHPLTAE
jgi:hypothetical protein